MKLTYEVTYAVHLRVQKGPSNAAQPELVEGTYQMTDRLARVIEDAVRAAGVVSVHVGLERMPVAWPDFLE